MQIGRDRTISPSVISIRRLPTAAGTPPAKRRRETRMTIYTSFHFHFPQWTAALLRVIPGAVISDARVGGGPGKNRWSSLARFDEASRRAPAVSARGRSARYEYEGTLAQLHVQRAGSSDARRGEASARRSRSIPMTDRRASPSRRAAAARGRDGWSRGS